MAGTCECGNEHADITELRGILLVEDLSASEEGLCSMELVPGQ